MISESDRERLRELLYEEIGPLLDELVEICCQDDFLAAYVPGNLWAQRYMYLGKSALDYVEDYLEEDTNENTETDGL